MSLALGSIDANETKHEAGGYVKGVAVAVVTQNRDDKGLCRVKVRYPWHQNAQESYWARLATPMAGKGRGLVIIPEIGDEVLVVFEREDLRFPYILGALWNGKDKPPIANDNGKNDRRLLRSRKQHHLLFDDGARGVVELAHASGRKVVLDDEGFVVQDEMGNSVRVQSNTGAMTIEAKGRLKISATSIAIEAATTLSLKATGVLSIQGATVTIN